MNSSEVILYEIDTDFDHYQVIDMVYVGRKARVLFSGQRSAAQSGIPRDAVHTMLFDYNQRFLDLINYLKPQNILLIGGGAFTLPMEILKYFPGTKIDVVERDAQLKIIAERFFGLKPHKNLNIIFNEGREYLQHTDENYDLVLIDAFSRSTIPKSLATREFVQLLSSRLSKKGTAAVNIISSYHGPKDQALKVQYATYKSVFRHIDIFSADTSLSLWLSQNFLQISTNRRLKPKYGPNFKSLHPPVINSGHILHD
jgi:spermidine synthase